MDITICDRCGNECKKPYRYNHKEKPPTKKKKLKVGFITPKSKKKSNKTLSFDLCEKCNKELKVFLRYNNEKKNKN